MNEQTIRDLIDQLEDLTRALSTTTRAGRTDATAGFDRGVRSMVNAMAKMTAQLKGAASTRREEQKFMKRFAADVDRATTAQQKQADAIERRLRQDEEGERRRNQNQNKSLAEQLAANRKGTSASRQLYEQLESTSSASDFLKNQFYDLGGSSKLGQASLRMLAATAQGTAKAIGTYGTSVYRGEIGAKTAAKALTDFVKPITDTASALLFFGSFFTPYGWVIKGLMRFGALLLEVLPNIGLKLNETAAEQADALFKSFRTISASGVNLGEGLDGVFDTLQTLGMSTAEIEEFNRVMTEAAKNTVFFGATAGMGAREFAKVAGGLYKSEFGRNLELMGITAAEQREAALMYMTIQARTGQLELRNTDRLIKGSAKFIEELDLAAQLTGQTRREQAAAREAALAEPRLRSAMISERVAAGRGDLAAQQRFARLERAAELAAIVGRFDPRAATGIRQAAAGGGALTTPEAVAAQMTYGINQVLSDPNMPLPDALRMLSANAKKNIETLAGVTSMTGTIEAIQTDIVGAADFYTKIDATIAGARDANMTIVDYLAAQQRAAKIPGETTELMTDAARMDQAAALTMQRTVNHFSLATDIYSTASKAFSDAVQALAKAVGVRPVPGGVPGAPAITAGGAPGATAMSQVATAGGSAVPPLGKEALAGLTFKSQESTAGAATNYSPKLIELAKLIQQNVPGFRHFSAFSDKHHQEKVPGSKHNQGLALDFSLGHWPSRAESDSIKAFLKASGASYVKDEYYDPSKGSTGGHFHVEVDSFARGGIASGPKSGYSAVLHGTEAVVPLPDGKTIPVTVSDSEQSQRRQIDMMSQQLNRLDDIVSVMREQIAVSTKILRVQQA